MAFSGFTANTAKHLQLDAGAFLINYDPAVDTWATAKATKLLGATVGGGSFSAVPQIRNIEVDGVKGAAKGLVALDTWEVNLTANVKEVTIESLKMALASANSGPATKPNGYTKITANNEIKDADFFDNITWVGRISGSADPVIIVVKNAICTNGLSINFADKTEGLVSLTITGYYDAGELDTPPFEIYYPPIT